MKFLKKLICVVCLIITTLVFNISSGINSVYSYTNSNSINFEEISLTNGYFNNSPNTTSLDKNPTGWSLIKQSSLATSGIINVNEKDNKFSANYSNYQLKSTENPRTISSDCDDKILMINSRNSSGIEIDTSQGFRSSDINLESYSFYEISILVCTMNSAYAGIYLTGFEDFTDEIQDYSSDKPDKFEYVKTSHNGWAEYIFYIQTNFNDISANLELYLGPTSSYTSTGVVFFDNISVLKVTESRFESDLSLTANKHQSDLLSNPNTVKKFSSIEMNKNYLDEYFSSEYNFDFETGQTKDSWLIIEKSNALNAVSRVLKVSSADVMKSYKLKNLGTDNSKNNNYALVLSSTETAYVGFSSKNIQISQCGIYKISINVKCDDIVGGAYVKLIENDDVASIYGEDKEFYTPSSSFVQISSNLSDTLKNDYTCISFYVSGHTLYDTSVKLELSLGSEDELSSGTVIFDNITIEKISYAQLQSKSSDSYNKIISFTTITSSPSVENGYFNKVINQDLNTSYPIEADDWMQTKVGNKNSALWGIVNTNVDKWTNNGINLVNPKNPSFKVGGTTITTPTTDSNNILMIYNKGTTYQTITSPKVSVSKNSFYTLSFDYRAPNATSILNFYIINENDKVVFEGLNLNSNVWMNYSIIIKTEHYASELKLVFEVGNEINPKQGVVYIDNVDIKAESFSNEIYLELVQNSNNKILDLSNIGFNIKGSKKNDFGIYEALLFDSNLEDGSSANIALGGIIDENNIYNLVFPENNISIVKNMLAISTYGKSSYSLTSKYELTLSAKSYYKFSIYIKTEFKDTIDDEDQHNYGAEFSLNGLKSASIKNIKSENFSEYSIYVYVDNDSSVQVKFGLTSDDYYTAGNAFFDSFKFETITDKKYKEATDSDNVLVFSTADLEEESQDDDEPEETQTSSGAELWIALSTIIMTIAVILAVVLSFLRRIEIKKYQIKKPITTVYDRATTVSQDIVVREVKNRQEEELKLLNKDIKELEEYLVKLEEENKHRVAQHRAKFGKGITRKSERDFKTYANTRSRVLKDIDKLNGKIKEVNSPEWLIQQEKLITNEKAKSKPVKRINESTDLNGKTDNGE